MVLSNAQILLWLGHFLWPFLRINGMFLTAPLYSSAFIPAHIKAITAAVFAAALAVWLPNLPAFPMDPISAIYQGVIQIGFGAALGLIMQAVIAAAAGAGEIAALSIGLGFAELQFREALTPTSVLYDIMFWAGLMGYLAAGGPIWLFAALAHSFQAGTTVASPASWGALAGLGGTLMSSAVALSMPVLAVSLSINISIGLLTVFAPQLNLLTVGFPLLMLIGMWMFTCAIGYFSGDFREILFGAMDHLGLLLNHV